MHLPVELTPAGIAVARRGLAQLEALLYPERPPPHTEATQLPDVVTVYEHARSTPHSRTPDLLELFARAEAPLSPEEIGLDLGAGKPLSKRSARAVVRNLSRMEGGLLKRGAIGGSVLVKDFSRYEVEGAGRYGLSPEDRQELRTHLARSFVGSLGR